MVAMVPRLPAVGLFLPTCHPDTTQLLLYDTNKRAFSHDLCSWKRDQDSRRSAFGLSLM